MTFTSKHLWAISSAIIAIAVSALIGGSGWLAPLAAQPSIGPIKDGVYYTIERSETVYKADAVRCGFNDLGFANMGVYTREHRRYYEIREGREVRTWRDTVDTFKRCYTP